MILFSFYSFKIVEIIKHSQEKTQIITTHSIKPVMPEREKLFMLSLNRFYLQYVRLVLKLLTITTMMSVIMEVIRMIQRIIGVAMINVRHRPMTLLQQSTQTNKNCQQFPGNHLRNDADLRTQHLELLLTRIITIVIHHFQFSRN
jgi:hypothetical protein